MSIINQLKLLQRIHRHVQMKRSGTPGEFALRLGISKSLLFRMMGEMRKLGAPIRYCYLQHRYVYEVKVELQLGFYRLEDTVALEPGGVTGDAVVRQLLSSDQAA